jgi:hypothetical protein
MLFKWTWYLNEIGLKDVPGSSCDRPTRSKFSMVFLGPRANLEFVHKYQVARNARHEAISILISKFHPKVPRNINIKISPNAAPLPQGNKIPNDVQI